MKKKAFLLLETLIALSLAITCAIPLAAYPLKIYRHHIHSLVQIEKERLADATLVQIKEKLLKNEIPWEKIPEWKASSETFHLPSIKIEIPSCFSREIKCTFSITTKREKKTDSGEITRYLHLTLKLDDSPYSFYFPVAMKPKGIL